jgi:hypothetical protein
MQPELALGCKRHKDVALELRIKDIGIDERDVKRVLG